MTDEYIVLRFFNIRKHNLDPFTSELKSSTFKDISEDTKNEILKSLYVRKFIEDIESTARTSLTKAGKDYLDKTYYLLQAYDIIDAQLLKIENHNDAIDISHIRGNHR